MATNREAPRTDPASRASRRCLACDSFVTRRFRRVFGDNDDEVRACPNCATTRQLTRGASTE